jgi:hypothetical protein
MSEPNASASLTHRKVLPSIAPGSDGLLVWLGTDVWDDTGPISLSARQPSLLASHGVEIADRGDVPKTPEAEASPPPNEPRRDHEELLQLAVRTILASREIHDS